MNEQDSIREIRRIVFESAISEIHRVEWNMNHVEMGSVSYAANEKERQTYETILLIAINAKTRRGLIALYMRLSERNETVDAVNSLIRQMEN